ncbi:MAG: hypothetical protein UIG52_06700 [Bacteroidales bacterium]|nr:hypothetical protein [Bacteroidales bacterium]
MREKVLYLSLKKKWFDLIKSGVKKEEYREIKPFYISRYIKFEPLKSDLIRDWATGFDEGEIAGIQDELIITSSKFDTLVFTISYSKSDDMSRRLVFKNPRIRMDEGKPEWGAEKGKKYFVITWEE